MSSVKQPSLRARLWITDQKQFYTSGDTIQGKLFLGASDSLNIEITRIRIVVDCTEHYRIKGTTGIKSRHCGSKCDFEEFVKEYNSKKGVDNTLQFEIKLDRSTCGLPSVSLTDFGTPDLGVMWSLQAEITASPIGGCTQDTQVIKRTTGFDFYPLNFDDLTSHIAMLSASTPTMTRWKNRNFSFEIAYPKVIPQWPQTFAIELRLTMVEPAKIRSVSVFLLKKLVSSTANASEVFTHRTHLARLEPNATAPAIGSLVVRSDSCQLGACEPGPFVAAHLSLQYMICVELDYAEKIHCYADVVLMEPVSHLRALEKAESRSGNIPVSEAGTHTISDLASTDTWRRIENPGDEGIDLYMDIEGNLRAIRRSKPENSISWVEKNLSWVELPSSKIVIDWVTEFGDDPELGPLREMDASVVTQVFGSLSVNDKYNARPVEISRRNALVMVSLLDMLAAWARDTESFRPWDYFANREWSRLVLNATTMRQRSSILKSDAEFVRRVTPFLFELLTQYAKVFSLVDWNDQWGAVVVDGDDDNRPGNIAVKLAPIPCAKRTTQDWLDRILMSHTTRRMRAFNELKNGSPDLTELSGETKNKQWTDTLNSLLDPMGLHMFYRGNRNRMYFDSERFASACASAVAWFRVPRAFFEQMMGSSVVNEHIDLAIAISSVIGVVGPEHGASEPGRLRAVLGVRFDQDLVKSLVECSATKLYLRQSPPGDQEQQQQQQHMADWVTRSVDRLRDYVYGTNRNSASRSPAVWQRVSNETDKVDIRVVVKRKRKRVNTNEFDVFRPVNALGEVDEEKNAFISPKLWLRAAHGSLLKILGSD